MTERTPDRIRELERRISEWDAEHRHEIRHTRNAIDDLNKTLKLSLSAAFLGSIPTFVWIICWIAAMHSTESIRSLIMPMMMAVAVFVVVVGGVARASGLAAFWWFRGSLIHERLAATIISLAAAFMIFGWVIYSIRW